MTCFHCEKPTKEETAIRLSDSCYLICFSCCDETGVEYQEKITLKEYGKRKNE